MSIVFNPAIPDTIHVPIDSSFTTLNFTATLNTADYDEFKRQGTRIQLWSDIPVDSAFDLSSRNWSSSDFEPDLASASDLKESAVNLGGADDKYTLPPGKIVLGLRILLSSSDDEQARFSFTYRILYSSGEIRWLGEFGRNGTLNLKRIDAKMAIELSSEWTCNQGGYLWMGADDANKKDIPVLRISKPEECVVYSLGGKDSTFSVAFIHRHNIHRISPAPEYLVCASIGSMMHLQLENTISISGNGPLFACALPRQQADVLFFKDTIMRYCPESIAVTAYDESLVVTSTSTLPVQGIILPSPREAFLSITAETLRALLSFETPPASFALYAPRTREVHLFSDPSRVLFRGTGQFMLSPAFKIAPRVYVAIMSLYASTRIVDNVLGALPTPPPSPGLLTCTEILPCTPTSSSIAPSVHNSIAPPSETEEEDVMEASTVLETSSVEDQVSKSEPMLLFRAFVLHMNWIITGSLFPLIMAFKLIFENIIAVTAHDEDEPEEAGLTQDFHSDAEEEPGSTKVFSSDKSNEVESAKVPRSDSQELGSSVTLASDFDEVFLNQNIANDRLWSTGGTDHLLDNENAQSTSSRPLMQAQQGGVSSLPGRRELSRNLELGLENVDMRLRKTLLVDVGDGDRCVKLAVWQGNGKGKVVVELNGKRVFSVDGENACASQAGLWEFEVTEGGLMRISYDCDTATEDMEPISAL